MNDKNIKDEEKTGLGKWMSGEGEKEEWEFIEKEKDKILIKNTKTKRAVMATRIGDNWQVTDGEKTMLTHIGDKPIERILESYVQTGELPKAKESPKKDAIPKEDQELIMSKMGFTEIESKPDLWMKKILLDEDQKEPTVLWIDFRKSDRGQYWTNNPKLDSLRLKTLGEVKALKLIGAGIIDPSKWDTGKPLETVNLEGGKEYVELSWTPEEIKEEKEEKPKETMPCPLCGGSGEIPQSLIDIQEEIEYANKHLFPRLEWVKSMENMERWEREYILQNITRHIHFIEGEEKELASKEQKEWLRDIGFTGFMVEQLDKDTATFWITKLKDRCINCGREISKKEKDYSQKNFGRQLCIDCQKGEKEETVKASKVIVTVDKGSDTPYMRKEELKKMGFGFNDDRWKKKWGRTATQAEVEELMENKLFRENVLEMVVKKED